MSILVASSRAVLINSQITHLSAKYPLVTTTSASSHLGRKVMKAQFLFLFPLTAVVPAIDLSK